MNFLMKFLTPILAPIKAVLTPLKGLMRIPMMFMWAPRKLMGMTLPGRVAVLLAIFLWICLIGRIVGTMMFDWAAFWSLTIWWWVVALALVIVIPIVVYHAVKLWLEGEESQFPQLDAAWQQGLDALAENNLSIDDIPLFLIIGSPDQQSCSTLLEAGGMEWIIDCVPSGQSPIHWYANNDAIYLVLSETGRLALANKGGQAARGAPAEQKADVRGTMEPGIRGTMVASGGDSSDAPPLPKSSSGEPDFGGGDAIRGTLVPGAPATGSSSASKQSAPASGGSISRREANEQTERLRYVCRLLRRARQPLAATNGILTILPFNVVEVAYTARDIPGAVKKDLETIRESLMLRCPVAALVTGMETENGFRELVRRVGVDRAKVNRFGKGFDVWNPPTDEKIDALSAHACGAFEDWVYNLFREKDGFSKPGNAKLFALLCKIRTHFQRRLRDILLNGFSFEPHNDQDVDDTMLFSGCYFAATGDSEDRQAFVRNIFEKMVEQEEELEWTRDAMNEDKKYHQMAQSVLFADSALVLGLAGLLIYWFWFSGS